MNLTNLVLLFLDIYKIYHNLSKFSLKTKLNKHLHFTETLKTKSYCAAQPERLGPARWAGCARERPAHDRPRRERWRSNTGQTARSRPGHARPQARPAAHAASVDWPRRLRRGCKRSRPSEAAERPAHGGGVTQARQRAGRPTAGARC